MVSRIGKTFNGHMLRRGRERLLCETTPPLTFPFESMSLWNQLSDCLMNRDCLMNSSLNKLILRMLKLEVVKVQSMGEHLRETAVWMWTLSMVVPM